jgi:signal transduction histidine kinase
VTHRQENMSEKEIPNDAILRELEELCGRIGSFEVRQAMCDRKIARLRRERRRLKHLVLLHERDRQLIRYDIHDGLAQQLAGAMFQLQSHIEQKQMNPIEAARSFDAAISLLREALEECRRQINGLDMPALRDLGIVGAIEALVRKCEEDWGVKIAFRHQVTFKRLARPLETTVFRIIQEIVTNACRHSGSDRIRVTLEQRDSRLRICVRDYGCGFDPEQIKSERLGLRGIRERVRLFHGRIAIKSAPGRGTHISVELPLVE